MILELGPRLKKLLQGSGESEMGMLCTSLWTPGETEAQGETWVGEGGESRWSPPFEPLGKLRLELVR